MTTGSQRAEHLILLRDLVVLGTSRSISLRSELKQIARDEQLLVTNSGSPFDYTSVYRYFDALRFLKLDASAKGQDEIVWTATAKRLAKCGLPNYHLSALSSAEQAEFRAAIFDSPVSEAFLSCFCPANFVPRSHEQFLQHAHSLYILNESVKRPRGTQRSDEWPADDNVEYSPDPSASTVFRKSRKEFLYAYRYWCLDAAIIDELNIREAERCGIPKRYSYLLYPVDTKLSLTPEQFLKLIDRSGGAGHGRVEPIPRLMYTVCPAAKVTVEAFKSSLLETWRLHRNRLHLERGPGGLIAGTVFGPQTDYGKRYGNHRYYVTVDGTIRSNLVILPLNT